MKTILFLIISSIQFTVYAQNNYWQQRVNYIIDVSLNDAEHSLEGFEKLAYTNNSPDTLQFIWFHIWPNAYKNNSTGFYRQMSKSKDRSLKLRRFKVRGYIGSLHFNVNGKAAMVEAHPKHIDLIKLLLPDPLLPGRQISITTPFHVKIPSYISRLGYADDMYMISQWYPKPAVYDKEGWHPMPYLDQGEFYSEFGSYRVNITVPSSYVVAATGVLLDSMELLRYRAIGADNHKLAGKYIIEEMNFKHYTAAPSSTFKTLHFSGDNIHDFAWFASQDFIIQYDTLMLQSGKIIDVFAFHQPDRNTEWANSISYVKDAVAKYSACVGEYAYPSVNVVEGPLNAASGGMEYPMITLITSPGADKEELDAVITHEVGHNWFYGILGTNERDHAWMDEGINTYYQFRYEAEKYRSNSFYGNAIPAAMKEKSADEFLGLLYNSFAGLSMPAPIETPSTGFEQESEYSLTVYIKAAMWMYILELSVGQTSLDKAMQHYFNEWRFRHPYPEDLRATMEKSLNKEMGNLFNLLYKKGILK